MPTSQSLQDPSAFHNLFLQKITFLVSILFSLPVISVSSQVQHLPSVPSTNVTIRVGDDYSYPPYAFLDRQGNPSGFNVELTRAVAQAANLNVNIRLGPWVEIRKALEEGGIDAISGMYYSEERDKLFSFTPPFLTTMYDIFVRDNSSIRRFDDVHNLKVLLQEGDIIHDYFLENRITPRILTQTDAPDVIRQLAAGQADCAAISRIQGYYFLQTLGLTGIHSIGAEFAPQSYCMAVRENNTILLNRLSEGLAIVQSTGQYNEIYTKWFGVYEKRQLQETLKPFLWALLIAVVLIVLILTWTWTLKRTVHRQTEKLRQANRAIKENEERWQYAIEGSELGVWDWEIPRKQVYISKWYQDLLDLPPQAEGYPEETILGIIHPDEQILFSEALDECIDGKRDFFLLEFRTRSKTGDYLWLHSRGKIMAKDPSGNALRMLGTLSDITNHRRKDEALRYSEALYHSLVEHLPQRIFRKDMEGRFTFANRQFCHDLGINQESIIGKSDFDLYPSNLAAKYNNDDRQIVRNGDIFETVEENHLPGQEIKYVQVVKIPVYDSEGKIIGVQGIFWDITEQRLTQEKLKLDESRLETLVRLNQMAESSLQEITHFALEEAIRLTQSRIGYIAFTNEDESVLTMYAWSKTAMAECRVKDMPWVYPVEKTGLWGEAIRQRKPIITNHYLDTNPWKKGTPAGHVQLIRHMNVPVFDGERIVLVAGVGNKENHYDQSDVRQLSLLMSGMWSIVQRKHAVLERVELERQIQHAQKLESLGILAGGIAHDFNNLLVAILGNSDLAKRKVPTESPALENLSSIEKAAQRAADLCRQMLAYSGKGRFVIEPLDLSEIVQDMSQMLEISISKKAVLRYCFPKDLPMIEADATQIRQIIMNLITNASESLEDRSGVITATTGIFHCNRAYLDACVISKPLPEGNYVFFEVQDTGCGMDLSTQAKLFDPFFSTKFTGRGLGLAAVLGIVRGHRGAIRVQSEMGTGTTFTVLFPPSKKEAAPPPSPSAKELEWHGTGSILLVDDEEIVCAVGREMLQRMGFEVTVAQDGRAAILSFQEDPKHYDCIILDLTMPYMDGEDTYHALRGIRSDVKILFCSGYSEQDISDRIPGGTYAGFIQKPFDYEELAGQIRAVLDKN